MFGYLIVLIIVISMDIHLVRPFWESDLALLLAVLLSIIALVALCLKYKPDNEKSSSIHTWYVSGIAVFLIIELVTYICMNNDNSSDIIKVVSFGATLASIILSVLAIFITVTSSDSILRARDGLDKTTEAIQDSIKGLRETRENLGSSFQNNLSEQAKNISEIHALLKKLEGAVEDGFERSRIQINDLTHKSTPAIGAVEKDRKDFSAPKLESFTKTTSKLCLAIILVSRIIVDKNLKSHRFLLSDLTRSIGWGTDESVDSYLLACLVVLSSFGLIDYSSSSDNKYSISAVNVELANKVEERLQDLGLYEDLKKKITGYLDSIDKGGSDSDLAK